MYAPTTRPQPSTAAPHRIRRGGFVAVAVAVCDPLAADSGLGRGAGHLASQRGRHVAVAPEPEAALALQGLEGRLKDLLGLGHRALLGSARSHAWSLSARLQVERSGRAGG